MARPSVKEHIVAAALDALHRQGFNATGVQDITDAAGVPKGSFYNHFESKEELGMEVIERYWQRALTHMSMLSDPDVPPLARLKSYFRALDDISRKNKYQRGCLIGNMAIEMSDQSRPIRERLAIVMAAWTRGIESCVREAQAVGSMRRDIDARLIASFLLNAWEGTVMRSKVDKNRAALEAFEKVVFTSLT